MAKKADKMSNDKDIEEKGNNGALGSAKASLTMTHKILIGGFSLLLVVIVAAVAVIYMMINKPEPERKVAETGNKVITEENAEREAESMQELINRTSFRTYMNNTWTFPDGESASSDAVLGNNAKNTLSLYVKVSLEDTGELLYTSEVLEPGENVDAIVLDQALPAGRYTALCNYNIIDEDGTEYNSTSVRINLSVLN